MNLKDSSVRIHQEERERIYKLKSSLDHQGALAGLGEEDQLGRGLVVLQAEVANSRIKMPMELSLVNTRSDGIKHNGGRSKEPQA